MADNKIYLGIRYFYVLNNKVRNKGACPPSLWPNQSHSGTSTSAGSPSVSRQTTSLPSGLGDQVYFCLSSNVCIHFCHTIVYYLTNRVTPYGILQNRTCLSWLCECFFLKLFDQTYQGITSLLPMPPVHLDSWLLSLGHPSGNIKSV